MDRTDSGLTLEGDRWCDTCREPTPQRLVQFSSGDRKGIEAMKVVCGGCGKVTWMERREGSRGFVATSSRNRSRVGGKMTW